MLVIYIHSALILFNYKLKTENSLSSVFYTDPIFLTYYNCFIQTLRSPISIKTNIQACKNRQHGIRSFQKLFTQYINK